MNIRLLRNTAALPDDKSQSVTNISQLTEPNYIDNCTTDLAQKNCRRIITNCHREISQLYRKGSVYIIISELCDGKRNTLKCPPNAVAVAVSVPNIAQRQKELEHDPTSNNSCGYNTRQYLEWLVGWWTGVGWRQGIEKDTTIIIITTTSTVYVVPIPFNCTLAARYVVNCGVDPQASPHHLTGHIQRQEIVPGDRFKILCLPLLLTVLLCKRRII